MTLGASFIAGTFSAAGLFALSISEKGFLMEPKTRSMVLLTRLVGWMILYYFPVYLIATSNIRGFYMYGTAPSDNSLVCLGTSLSPSAVADFADSQRINQTRAVIGILIQHGLQLAIIVFVICVYIGDQFQYLGIGVLFAAGRIGFFLADIVMRPWVVPDPLCKAYAYIFAPKMIGISVGGFFAFTAAYCALRHQTNVWVGLAMPAILSCYKMIGVAVVNNAFTRGYVTKKATRQAYAHSAQGDLASAAIAGVQAHGEAARMVWILYGVVNEDSDSYWEYLVPVVAGTIWNIVARTGVMDRLWDVLTCGWLAPSRSRVLLHDSKSCMSYPRFVTIGAIFCARFCALGEVLPDSQTSLGLALLAMLLAELLEDFFCHLLRCTGLRLGRRRRHMFAEDFEAGRISSVVPSDEVTRATSVKEEYDRILAAYDFSYQLGTTYDALPFWLHFAIIATVQLHTILAFVFFVNGLNYTLGLCATPQYYGQGHARLWWPITDTSDFCAAG